MAFQQAKWRRISTRRRIAKKGRKNIWDVWWSVKRPRKVHSELKPLSIPTEMNPVWLSQRKWKLRGLKSEREEEKGREILKNLNRHFGCHSPNSTERMHPHNGFHDLEIRERSETIPFSPWASSSPHFYTFRTKRLQIGKSHFGTRKGSGQSISENFSRDSLLLIPPLSLSPPSILHL